MKVVIGYARVSTQGQAETELSLGAQRQAILRYARDHEMEMALAPNGGVIEDRAISASIPLPSRPGGAALIRMTERHTHLHVVVSSLDRAFRSTIDCLEVVKAWNDAGVTFTSIREGIDTSTAIGKFFLTVLAALAELERGLISERTKTALRIKKEKGEVYGQVPYGYVARDGTLYPDRAAMACIGRILYLKERQHSWREICRILEEEGRTTKKGKKKWDPKTVLRIYERTMESEGLRADAITARLEEKAYE